MVTPQTESPVALIRRAGAHLRQLTTDLGDNRGPWYIVNEQADPYPQNISNIGVPYCVASTHTDPHHPPTIARYICAMHPGVGKALAGLLDSVASNAVENDHEHLDGSGTCGTDTCDVLSALATARAVLSGVPQ